LAFGKASRSGSISGRILLHSDQSPELTGKSDATLLTSLTSKRNPRIGVIPSLSDPRKRCFQPVLQYYNRIGFECVAFFDPCEEYLESWRDHFDVLHLCGGHPKTFRDRLMFSECVPKLMQFHREHGLILGVSAGAMILGCSFRSASLMGEKGPFEGLGFFDFEIIPHVKENFPNTKALQFFSTQNQIKICLLNDGDSVVWGGKKPKIFGNPQFLEP
jgi:dipeptidase E